MILHDSSEYEPRGGDTHTIHYSAETVLNHLGLKVLHHDIQSGLPSPEKTQNILGILSWYLDNTMPNAKEYCYWASQQIKDGKKFVILGFMGAFKDSITQEEIPNETINLLYESLGLKNSGDWTDNTFLIKTDFKNSNMIEYERSLKPQTGAYEKIHSLNNDNKIYLSLKRSDIENSQSAVVVTTPFGGFAMREYEIFIDYFSLQIRWIINPFQFFTEAFDIKDTPRFDTTTLFGRRIFYSHIDGDGFRNIVKFDTTHYAGEIIDKKILQRYPWPITVSFITAEIDPQYFGSPRLQNIAKTILQRPHVEAGAHAFSHPLDWENQLTAFEIAGYSKKNKNIDPEAHPQDSLYLESAVITASRQEYIQREVEGAIDYINNNLLPPGKTVQVYQWSGNCRPPAEAIILADRKGVVNINGGDSRFDRAYPSYSRIAPLTRQINGAIQIFSSNANENIYTNGWLHPFWGFKHVIETFNQTEIPDNPKMKPRRISPINIYYHFYIAEQKMGLESLKYVYEFVKNKPLIPIFTSDYIKGVKGFISGEIFRLNENGWLLKNYGFCRTVRFDQSSLVPNLKQSRGVLGFKKWKDYLYVHLDESQNVQLYMQKDFPKSVYLEETSTVINNFRIFEDTISFKTIGFEKGVYRFRNMTPGNKYFVNIDFGNSKHSNITKSFSVKNDGVLNFNFSFSGPATITIKPRG